METTYTVKKITGIDDLYRVSLTPEDGVEGFGLYALYLDAQEYNANGYVWLRIGDKIRLNIQRVRNKPNKKEKNK